MNGPPVPFDPATGLADQAAMPQGRPWQEPDGGWQEAGRTDLYTTIDSTGRTVRRDASAANRAATLGPDSRTSTGAPSLLANLRPAALRALRTSRGRTTSLGEPKTLLGALMLNTSYVVVVRYSMRRVS